MATVLPVTDPADPRLRDFLALTDVSLRRRREPAEGLFIAEGEKVIRRALAAGYELRSLLLAQKWLPSLADVVAASTAPVLVAPVEVLRAVTGYDVHRGALASMARRPLPSVASLLPAVRRVAVLEDLTDHANVGVVFRCAAALGLDAVLLSPRCADPLYRRSVKVSMGAVFTLPYARFGCWPQGLESLRAAGFALLALTPTPQALPLGDLGPVARGRMGVLFGAEGTGLSAGALAAADLAVRIPMANGVDSLNVGAAAAVAFYALAQPGGPWSGDREGLR